MVKFVESKLNWEIELYFCEHRTTFIIVDDEKQRNYAFLKFYSTALTNVIQKASRCLATSFRNIEKLSDSTWRPSYRFEMWQLKGPKLLSIDKTMGKI